MQFIEENDTLCCVFSGDLNGRVCTDLEPALNEQIGSFSRDRDGMRLIFDLGEVRYVSSAFLRLCLYFGKSVGISNFSISNATSNVMQVFQVAGFTEIMNIGEKL